MYYVLRPSASAAAPRRLNISHARASPGRVRLQEVAAQQSDMLARLVAVRGAIDGGSRCPSCYAHELGATNPAAQMDGSADAGGVGVMEDRAEQASHRAASAAGEREVSTSIALSPSSDYVVSVTHHRYVIWRTATGKVHRAVRNWQGPPTP